jgi:hypothetical protein
MVVQGRKLHLPRKYKRNARPEPEGRGTRIEANQLRMVTRQLLPQTLLEGLALQ